MLDTRTDITSYLEGKFVSDAGANLAGLVLGTSDLLNSGVDGRAPVVLALESRDVSQLRAVAESVRETQHRFQVSFLVTDPEGIRRAADCFPGRFLVLQEHHRLVAGSDPFAGMTIGREYLRVRAEQELRNLDLRLTRRFLETQEDPDSLIAVMLRARAPLAVAARALLVLRGDDSPRSSVSEVYAAVQSRFEVEEKGLEYLAALGSKPGEVGDPVAGFVSVSGLLRELIQLVDQIKA